MGLVYLPTFTIAINHPWIGKYTSPMDPMGLFAWISTVFRAEIPSCKCDIWTPVNPTT